MYITEHYREQIETILRSIKNEVNKDEASVAYINEKLDCIKRRLEWNKQDIAHERWKIEQEERMKEEENKKKREEVIREETQTTKLILSGNMVVIDINKEEEE